MATPTVTPTRPIVKLSDRDMLAGISKRGDLCIRHQTRLLAVLNLDDAIRMAQVVLRYAVDNGIDVSTAGNEVAAMPEDWFDSQDEYAPRF